MVKKILLLFLMMMLVLSACGTLDVTVERAPAPPDLFGPGSTPAPTSTVRAGTDPLGAVYFFTFTQGNNGPARLMRLPGACVAGKQDCPAAEPLSLPDNTYANHSLTCAWSSDGKKVALTSVPGTGQDRLFVSELPDLAWKQIAQFDSIQLVTWSPDGNWISFGVADLQGWKDFYVIHPDGSGLENITATDKLPAEDQPYIVDGWMNDDLIVHSAKPGRVAGVYLLGVEDGQVKLLFNSYPTNATFYPSPDGSLLALNEYDDNSQFHTLQVIAPDGSGLHYLGGFKWTIYSLVWSPDGNSLAFAVNAESNPSQAAAYLVGRDGRGLKQVYNSSRITNINFSPDGQFLLVAGGDQQQFFVVDLNSLEAHLLQAPGLSLTNQSILPAWTP